MTKEKNGLVFLVLLIAFLFFSILSISFGWGFLIGCGLAYLGVVENPMNVALLFLFVSTMYLLVRLIGSVLRNKR